MIRKLAKLYSNQSDRAQQYSYFTGGQEMIPGTNFHLDFQEGLMGGSKELLILEVLAGMMAMTSGSI